MAMQVTVTGGAGYIASTLIQQLLEKAYTVNATVRSVQPGNPKTLHLRRLADALPGELHLFEADLLLPGSFDAAVAGSSFVFHTASPVFLSAADPQRDLVDPAVEGTKNVLAAVAKSKDSVRRVIFTSSVAAVLNCSPSLAPDPAGPVAKSGQLYSEEDFNEAATLETAPYALSKVLAEKAAWEWSRQEGVPLVSILPSWTLGPLLHGRDSVSPGFIVSALEGTVPDVLVPFVDVRDVARAHILAAEVPTASGRYLLTAPAPFNTRWLFQVLRARFPQYDLPEGDATPMPIMMDNSKVQRELGLTFRPMSETVIDTAATAIALGIVTPALLKQAACT